MRIILVGLTLVLAAAPASAECTCACRGNQSMPVCSPPALVKPICQQICTPKVGKSVSSGAIAAGGVGGGGGAAALAGAAGIDPSALRALLGR